MGQIKKDTEKKMGSSFTEKQKQTTDGVVRVAGRSRRMESCRKCPSLHLSVLQLLQDTVREEKRLKKRLFN